MPTMSTLALLIEMTSNSIVNIVMLRMGTKYSPSTTRIQIILMSHNNNNHKDKSTMKDAMAKYE
jgi:hypothetical protein